MLSSKLSDTDSTIIILKICSIIGILAMGFGFGIMPNCINSCRTSSTFLGLSNAFSGGLFLGIVLFHLLPEASEIFEEYFKTEKGQNSIFNGKPLCFFIVYLSYALILFIEKVLIRYFFGNNTHNHKNFNFEEENVPFVEDNPSAQENQNDKEIILKEDSENNKVNGDQNMHSSVNYITPYLLMIALSIHGLFEGIALGVMNKIKQTFFLFLAISAHKWAEAFSLGINFYCSKISKISFLIIISIFAMFAPIGIITGMIFSKINTIVQGILLSLSSGTFFYVSCNELIVEEFEKNGNNIIKFLMFFGGATLVGALSFCE